MQTGNATFRQDIADVIQENNLGEGQFMGTEIMPIMSVGAKSGQFAKLAFSNVKTKAVDDKRATSGYYNEVVHSVTTDNYTSVKRGLIEPVDDDDAKVLGKYFDAEVSSADHCRYYLKLNREARIAAIAFSTAIMAAYTAPLGTSWAVANKATATPVNDIQTAIDLITVNLNGMAGAGARIIGCGNLSARRNLIGLDDIIDRHYSGGNKNRAVIRNEQLADILGLDAVYFSGLRRGGADIWNADRFGIYLVSESMLLRSSPQFGRTMLWRDSTPSDMMVETYREEGRESNMVRVKHHSVEKTLTLRAGYLYTNCD